MNMNILGAVFIIIAIALNSFIEIPFGKYLSMLSGIIGIAILLKHNSKKQS